MACYELLENTLPGLLFCKLFGFIPATGFVLEDPSQVDGGAVGSSKRFYSSVGHLCPTCLWHSWYHHSVHRSNWTETTFDTGFMRICKFSSSPKYICFIL